MALPVKPLIPAAQYVRMSDEQQVYSIANQKAAIEEYAAAHGFQIVKTYADPGRSGVEAKRRTALQALLQDVLSGCAKYEAILVYDVSRWGRYPNNDEAAHYEFLCQSSGIPLHYCAEPFLNDGTPTSSLVKDWKRSMAAEYSRELSVKVTRGKTRIVQMGYWVGGQPGYGFRRMMISPDGKRKRILKLGEQKQVHTDRIILVPGPASEQKIVRLIFSLAIAGNGSTAIATELNRQGFTQYGKPWISNGVFNVLTNPKYAGWNVWKRTSRLLQTKERKNTPDQWVTKQGAFSSIVDQETYDEAQRRRKKKLDYWWSEKEMLRQLRRLFTKKGYLSQDLLLKTPGMPAISTLHHHFGTYRQMYELVGYHVPDEDMFKGEQTRRSMLLRRRVIASIKALFPGHISITRVSATCSRSVLVIDGLIKVSLLLARENHGLSKGWVVAPNPNERDFITLVCTMSPDNCRVIGYYLLPHTHPFGPRQLCDGYLRRARQLRGLSELYADVKRLWAERSCVQPVRTNFP